MTDHCHTAERAETGSFRRPRCILNLFPRCTMLRTLCTKRNCVHICRLVWSSRCRPTIV